MDQYRPETEPPPGTCPFCNLNGEIVVENADAIAVGDAYPVSPGHTLILPRRHVETMFSLSQPEYRGCFDLVREASEHLMKLHSADGINIGVNTGRAAGQTVMHAHIHVIPRFTGDVVDPRGGIRSVIPSKQKY